MHQRPPPEAHLLIYKCAKVKGGLLEFVATLKKLVVLYTQTFVVKSD